ncbi:GTPase [Nonomuraea endophytica]|uniref:GTP-binding protein EngB required for normal cell division n=1 Tax=Nonomuraea endophytica TaxID=714136 RepID=A0A7W8ADJ3_9ACTN|nr:GTPase [Nonomuraea endophytica]MBB5083210.1 GTP-binding protein EngB required for normal cell division [Nonomuraea endophytica]
MKLLRRGPSLDDRLNALLEAADLAGGRLPADVVAAAREVADRAGVRRSLSVDHTVAALAGATGSGKSSLFNELTGAELATVGVTRPTTSTAQAALWDGDGAGPLLDWLEIPRRHAVAADTGLAGLVLLDLPDHDSIELGHRLEVDRLVEVVDLLVWVLDPQKYADAAVHERYLRPLARHREVMVVVLNQIDRLPAAAVSRCLADLRRLLADDGLDGVPVLGVSARTGAGLPELRSLLGEKVAARLSWAGRLSADVATAADALAAAGGSGGGVVGVSSGLSKALTGALSTAAGVPLVVDAVGKAHRHRAVVATGWPVTRWVRRFRPDPLRRLRIGGSSAAAGEIVGKTSLPEASGVQKAQVETAIRDVGEAAAEGLPGVWAASVRRAARSRAGELADALDKAVSTTSLSAARRPRWWRAVGLVQWVVFAAMAAGALWLGVLFGLDYLRLPELPTPTLLEVPWPTVLLVLGALAGVLVALLSRVAAWIGGRRRARGTAKALRAAVGEVARTDVLDPVTAELDRYTAFTTALTQARQ